MNTATPQLDPDIVALAKAFRETETRGQKDPYTAKGASGEFGAYQNIEPTWKARAAAAGLGNVEWQKATREQQNEVMYKWIESKKKEGYNPGQIASMQNAGEGEPDAYTGKFKDGRPSKGINKYNVEYDVPSYAKAVVTAYHAYKQGAGSDYVPPTSPSTIGQEKILSANEAADRRSAEATGAFFPAVTGDSAGKAGLKAAGNLIPSAFNFAKGAIETLNPINIAKNLAAIPGEAAGLVKDAGGVGNALKAFGSTLPKTAYETLVPQAAREAISGDIEGAARTVTNDPFGQVAPFVFAARGAAGVAERSGALPRATAQFDAAVSKISDTATAPARYAFGKAGDMIGGTTKYAVAKTSGLNPETISTIIENPAAFSKEGMTSLTRKSLGDEVAAKLKERSEALADTGSEYSSIRNLRAANTDRYTGNTKTIKNGPGGQEIVYNLVDAADDALTLPELRQKVSLLEAEKNAPKDVLTASRAALEARTKTETVPHKVKVKSNDLDGLIRETTGLTIKDGALEARGASSIRDAKDVRALQQFYNTWQKEFAKGYLTTEEYLNIRADLAKLAKFERELTSSAALENLSGIMRGKLNTKYRSQIPGLEELDAKFAPMISDYKTLSKGFVDKDGNLTDTAINRIANAGGKGKDALLARLEEISPGITLKIRTLKAIEDIQNIHKVGTYTKSAIEGGGLVGGIATGNLPLIAGSIVAIIFTQPEVAVRMIRAYGNTKALAGEVLHQIGAGTNAALESDVSKALPSAFGARQLETTTK